MKDSLYMLVWCPPPLFPFQIFAILLIIRVLCFQILFYFAFPYCFLAAFCCLPFIDLLRSSCYCVCISFVYCCSWFTLIMTRKVQTSYEDSQVCIIWNMNDIWAPWYLHLNKKHKRMNQFHKILHQGFIACFLMILVKLRAFNIEILFMLIGHIILWKGNTLKMAGGDCVMCWWQMVTTH